MKNANEILKDIYNQVKKLYADADENQKGAAVGSVIYSKKTLQG